MNDPTYIGGNVYVIGVFDLFHTGHVELLRRARALGDKLVVAINGDDMVAQYKRRPFIDEDFIIRCFDNKHAIIDHNIDLIVHGDDWKGESYLEQIRITPKFAEEHHLKLVYLPYTKGISTTDIIKSIRERKDM